MKIAYQTLLLICLVFFSQSVIHAETGGEAAVSSDLYWVTFSGDCHCDSVFVMQIDAGGNITIPPKAVLTIADFGAGASALAKKGSSALSLYHWKQTNAESVLMRAKIDKATLKLKSKKITKIKSWEDDFLQVSQNPKGKFNFLLAEVPLDTFKEFALNSKGLPSTTGKDAMPQLFSPSDEGSVAADGLAVVSNRGDDSTGLNNELYFQLMDQNGVPAGKPELVASFLDIESVDVTSALESGKRFVVYVVDSGTKPDDKIFLQVMDANGKKAGSKITINTPPDRQEDNQNVAIDPQGRFVLFTEEGSKHGCPFNDILVYQALTPEGKKKGGEKVVVSCGLVSDDIINLDILLE